MTEASPDLQAATTELGQAIHRDHEALKVELGRAIRRDHSRRKRRRKAIRTSALSLGAVLVLSGSALAAGDALGVIDLGGGVSAARVSSVPVWDGSTGTFVTGSSLPVWNEQAGAFVGGGNGSPYIYHLTGGSDPTLSCGPTDPEATNNIYVTSTHPLTSAELTEILDEEVSHETTAGQTIVKEVTEGKLPGGAKWVRTGRHPIIGGGSTPKSTRQLFPAGVTGVSNGCPTPGVAGQPGSPGSPAAPGKAGVTVTPSAATSATR
ncbi:MAG: hypothetical protein ACLPUT_16915 [Solirubrobacteraceae bacterium]